MDELKNFSKEELEQEIERREAIELQSTPPELLKEPDIEKLRKSVTDYVQHIVKEGFEQKNGAHYVYEDAMEAFYGKSYWDWHNEVVS
jgi:hypothetical protein